MQIDFMFRLRYGVFCFVLFLFLFQIKYSNFCVVNSSIYNRKVCSLYIFCVSFISEILFHIDFNFSLWVLLFYCNDIMLCVCAVYEFTLKHCLTYLQYNINSMIHKSGIIIVKGENIFSACCQRNRLTMIL